MSSPNDPLRALAGRGASAANEAGADAAQASPSVSAATSATLLDAIRQGIAQAGGWWPFDRFMQAALYAPGLGYYASGKSIFGTMPASARNPSGSDFITAPELSPLFARALAVQAAQVMRLSGSGDVWEFGAGSGALAEGLLDSLGDQVSRYTIVEVSGALRATQQARLARFGERVQWAVSLPDTLSGLVVGNEVLDAMPVKRLSFDGERWLEQGVAVAADGSLVWQVRPTTLTPPLDAPVPAPYETEVHLQAEAFVATIAQRLAPGAVALLLDYGFPQAEYYHPQRDGGTLMCHQAHRSDDNPLADVGAKDITAHINFTGVALAAQDAGASVMGYTSQGRFLLNCGITDWMQGADARINNAAHRLLAEHEMGELFKAIAFGKPTASHDNTSDEVILVGFAAGDRLHRL
jgi:SAM-dependent MidA family methyltransferase